MSAAPKLALVPPHYSVLDLLALIVKRFAKQWPHHAFAKQSLDDTIAAHAHVLHDCTAPEIRAAHYEALKRWGRWEDPQQLRRLALDVRTRTQLQAPRLPVIDPSGTERWRDVRCIWCAFEQLDPPHGPYVRRQEKIAADGSVIHASWCVRDRVHQESTALAARRALHLPLEDVLDAEQEAKLAAFLAPPPAQLLLPASTTPSGDPT